MNALSWAILAALLTLIGMMLWLLFIEPERDQCRHQVTTAIYHTLEGTWVRFAYCPQCGKRIT